MPLPSDRRTAEEIQTLVLRPLCIQFEFPKRVNKNNPATLAEFTQQWVNALNYYSIPALQKAIKKAIETEEFFPKISKIREFAAAEERGISLTAPAPLPKPKTWREKNATLVNAWQEEHTPVFEDRDWLQSILRLACAQISSSNTPQEATESLNNTLSSLKKLKNPPKPRELNKLRAFTKLFIELVENNQPQQV